MENTDAYCPCIEDMDIEKGKSETPKTNDEPVGKNEDLLAVSSILHIYYASRFKNPNVKCKLVELGHCMRTLAVLSTNARTLQRPTNVQMGGNFMQLLMDHSLLLPKFNFRDKSGPEIIYDMSNSRPRKYKRSASFNSREVVLLFSVLSSVGTLILIYLTLRIRQMANGSVHG